MSMMEKRFGVTVGVLIGAFLLITLLQQLFGVSLFGSYSQHSIQLGAEWFLNAQNEDFLHYEYNYIADGYSPEHHSLREMGALWAVSSLADYLQDERYDALAAKGFNYFKESLVEDEENNLMFSAITPNKSKLGYNAFLILSLLEIDSVPAAQKDVLLQQLANGIIYQQNEDGSFRTFFYSDLEGGVDYYPGQALLALMKLYNYNQNPIYLDAVTKALPYYTGYRQSHANSAFSPWQTRAYLEYYKVTEDKNVADYVFSMNDYYIKNNGKLEECSEFIFNKGIATAVQIESVTKAYELAKMLNDKERMNCYASFVQEASAYIQKLQVVNPDRYSIRAIGGFRSERNSPIMRVDNNQHAVMALIEARQAGIIE